MELLQSEPALFVGLVFLFGLLVGSFLNVVIHRLPRMMEADWRAQCAEMRGEPAELASPYNLWTPRSACPVCGHPVSALENIPVLSWLWLRGRCSGCGASISVRYPLVEGLTAVLSALAAWKFGFGWAAIGSILFICGLIALAFIDLDTTLLPDDITLPLLWLGLLFNLFGIFVSLQSAVIGAMAGYLVLWSVYWLFKFATGKEGMGFGDFKLLAAIGAWLGWEQLPVTILLSSVVGALIGISMVIFIKHDRRIPIPFGPYLAGGGLVAMFFGTEITRAYLGSF
ncbi:MAG: prepilin peptidase [Hydrogenophilaceae bacterium]|nr:prepilin peptidase [Hydrogenophilaceae bacterium]